MLCFDLDGTLAPIVAHRQHASVPAGIAALMQALMQHWPVAVVTGRDIDDAAPRLGFRPDWLWGCHGAQRRGAASAVGWDGRCGKPDSSDAPDPIALRRALDGCRTLLAQNAQWLAARRVDVEDKGLSIALHYRHAEAAASVAAWLDGLLAPLTCPPSLTRLMPQGLAAGAGPGRAFGLHAEHGHCVLNLSAAAAPDKGDALLDLLAHCQLDRALVMGDDANDEPAFAKAPPDCVSIRIAPAGTPTRARFRLTEQTQVETLLRTLVQLRR